MSLSNKINEKHRQRIEKTIIILITDYEIETSYENECYNKNNI